VGLRCSRSLFRAAASVPIIQPAIAAVMWSRVASLG
jgi:hypothetical protein